ncbi:MAG: acyltransferase [Gemmatimonadaceae bacterium]
MWVMQKILGFNRGAYWPTHFTSRVNQWQNILVGIDTAPGYEPGCYIQGLGKIRIGDYTEIASNVGIISANHDVYDHSLHDKGEGITIGSYCWIGMGAIILPGVELGDFTVVGAGSVVTKSVPEGYAVVAGNPARMVRRLEPERCVRYKRWPEYRGYVRADRFEKWRRFRLWI